MTEKKTPRAPLRPPGEFLRGIWLLLRFQPEGFGLIGHTPAAFFNSLAPAFAFPIVRAAFLAFDGNATGTLRVLLSNLVMVLAPAVVSHLLATWWKREAFWLSYIIAFNWCLSALSLVLLLIVGLAPQLISPSDLQGGSSLVLILIAFYWIGLSWFLARRGLHISGWRAALFLLVLNVVSGVLFFGPAMLTPGLMRLP
jgi:hypothetical protein